MNQPLRRAKKGQAKEDAVVIKQKLIKMETRKIIKVTGSLIFVFLIIFLLSTSLVLSHEEGDFAKAEEIIKSNASCSQLTEEQLELIGDYYMEQMHPGDAHEIMDERMGGEGSETLRQMHINMAIRFYCNEYSNSMMGTMMGMMGMGMMGTSMMGYSNIGNTNILGGENMAYNMMGYGMMGSGTLGASLFGIVYFVLVAFVFSVIFWGTYNWLIKNKKRK